VKASMVSELGVLSGIYAGLPSFFQAAAVDRRLLRDVSQRVRTNQVSEREQICSDTEHSFNGLTLLLWIVFISLYASRKHCLSFPNLIKTRSNTYTMSLSSSRVSGEGLMRT